ncbi:MAG: CDP-diacylglycerol--glycerol-3-phosphate 3-phosphatidyltransferase [Leptospiraceae bacterium]|nr:CDP-diacylglycerol--glycerol-3-phosphate 3-phosphatidyltransferase [Leptospiraceae bacterium]
METKEDNLNLPNFLTIIRILLVPFFLYCLFQEDSFYKTIAFGLFLFASLTDFLDGYLARKWNQTTEFGKFLDPLADKILVTGAFGSFILLNEQVEFWMVLLIVMRDMLITCLRYIGISQGKSVKTTNMAKLKTAFQMSAILVLVTLLMVVSTGQKKVINNVYEKGRESGKFGLEIATDNLILFTKEIQNKDAGELDWINYLAAFLPYYLMLITTAVTVLSGIRYLISNYELLKPKNLMKGLKNEYPRNPK